MPCGLAARAHIDAITAHAARRFRRQRAVGIEPGHAVLRDQHILIIPAEEDAFVAHRWPVFRFFLDGIDRRRLPGMDDFGEAVVVERRFQEDFVELSETSQGRGIFAHGKENRREDAARARRGELRHAGRVGPDELWISRRLHREVARGRESEEQPAAFGERCPDIDLQLVDQAHRARTRERAQEKGESFRPTDAGRPRRPRRAFARAAQLAVVSIVGESESRLGRDEGKGAAIALREILPEPELRRAHRCFRPQ